MKIARNADMIVGFVLFAAVVAAAVYGELLAPHDAYFVSGVLDGRSPPLEPGPGVPLGTDDVGHDLWSWLLIGARTTLGIALVAAVLRLLIGGALGAIAGWQGGRKEVILARIALGFSSFPATILGVLGVIAFNVYSGALGFALALGLLGWADVFGWTRRETSAQERRAYIESARSVGMREERVVLRHLVPNIAAGLIALLALQVSAVLLLLGELGLLRIFIGGPVVEYGPTGRAFVSASQPDWSGMLAATRPISAVSGGALWQLLAPAGALVFAVTAINLFGTALAQRAQTTNIYALVQPKAALAVVFVMVLTALPLLLRPDPLQPELDYAQAHADGQTVDTIARHLVEAPQPRAPGTSGARAAAEYLAVVTGGTLLPVTASVLTPTISLRLGTGTLAAGGDLELIAEDDASVSGPAVAILGSPFGLTRHGSELQGRVAFAVSSGPSLDTLANTLRELGARGLVLVSDSSVAAPHGRGLYAIPVVRAARDAILRLLGRDLPSVDELGNGRVADLDVDASLVVRVAYTQVSGTDVVIRRAGIGPPDRPLILVVAGYEETGVIHYLGDGDWLSASSAGLVASVAKTLQAQPIRADVVLLLTAGDQANAAGLVVGLEQLSAAERERAIALIAVNGALGPFLLQPDAADSGNTSAQTAGGRVAHKLADALGLRLRPQRSRTLSLIARAADVRVPTFALLGAGDGLTPPNAQTERGTVEVLLTLVAYLASHVEDLRR